MTNIQKTEAFLRERFAECAFFREHPADGEYRLQHSYRVAHAAGKIARREGLDQEGLVIGGLLHDVGYSLPFGEKDGSNFYKRLMTNWLITAGHSFSLVLRYWVVIQLEILFQSTEVTEIITIRQESLKWLLIMLMVEYKLVWVII